MSDSPHVTVARAAMEAVRAAEAAREAIQAAMATAQTAGVALPHWQLWLATAQSLARVTDPNGPRALLENEIQAAAAAGKEPG